MDRSKEVLLTTENLKTLLTDHAKPLIYQKKQAENKCADLLGSTLVINEFEGSNFMTQIRDINNNNIDRL